MIDLRSALHRLWPAPTSARAEAALDRHLQQMVIFYGRGCAIVLNLMHLLFWPMDRLLLAADPVVHQVMPWFRATTFTNHTLFLVALAAPGLRRFPLPLFVVCALISSALLGTAMSRMGGLDHPYFYMACLVPMGLGAMPVRPLSRLWLGPACAAALCAAYFATRPGELASPLLGSALGCMGFAAAVSLAIGQGMFLLTRRAFFSERALSAHLAQAAEAERSRLSRELHDETGQQIAALRYALASARQCLRTEPEQAARSLWDMDQGLAQLAAGVRHLVVDLRPRVLDERGLGPALRWLVDQVAAQSGLACDLELDLAAGVVVPPEQATAAYRVVQESLTNAARHARAKRVQVLLRVGAAGLEASVADDGCGVGPVDLPRTGMGLIGMEERAQAHGGRLMIKGRPGAGTVVLLHLPLLPGGDGADR